MLHIIHLSAMLILAGPQASDGTAIARAAVSILHEKCSPCHGTMRSSNFDLRSREALLKGGTHGVDLIPGHPDQSRLIARIIGKEKPRMPPARPLSDAQIATLRTWVAQGAVWTTDANPDRPWPFNRIVHPVLPVIKGVAPTNPIDRFILANLQANALHFSPPADRTTLIRRVTLDLIGLPPTPAEVDAFLKDTSPIAYEKVIDRLLASPHYGERWARHWLDLARYAESEGFKSDELRPNAWRYRDYVIQSLNADKPYDRFIKEQIAGDELWPNDPDALVATGFCRHYADESNARNLLQRRQEILNDITETVGSTLLGLTWNCARCHDHKYDPLPQKDYYRLQAFFAGVRPRDDLALIPQDRRTEYDRRMKDWDEKTTTIRSELESLEGPIRAKIAKVSFDKFPMDVQNAVNKPANQRTAMDWFLYHKAESYFRVPQADIEKQLPKDKKERLQALKMQLDSFKALHPGPMPTGQGITDLGSKAPPTYRLATGVYDAFLEEVQPGFPVVFGGGEPTLRQANLIPATTGRRSALAEWLASKDNPLTARVMVNRIWHHHFGQGIVATPSDFGYTGEPPANQALLDWLAAEFMQRGWSMKQIHKLILTSQTYRQSVASTPSVKSVNAVNQVDKAEQLDPQNRLLWRFNRRRLEGEVIRDSMLAVSGELNPKMGGPGVMAELPKGLTTRGYWKETTDPEERSRRSIYIFVKRNLRYPFFELFDMPDTHEPCARRTVTITAPQALLMMNDETAFRAAKQFAQRVTTEVGSNRALQVEAAWRLAFARTPTKVERFSSLKFLERQEAVVGEKSAALVDFCHTLLNANEFVYVD